MEQECLWSLTEAILLSSIMFLIYLVSNYMGNLVPGEMQSQGIAFVFWYELSRNVYIFKWNYLEKWLPILSWNLTS